MVALCEAVTATAGFCPTLAALLSTNWGGLPRLHPIERDIDDHIFLPADHLAATNFDQDRAGIDAIICGRFFGMVQEV